MTDTRQNILDTAKRLFTERGYNAVSVADIAGELGISKGNLTYHFRKKENIMQAIMDVLDPQMPDTIPSSLVEMNDYIIHLESVTQDNVFYFRNYSQIAGLSEKQREKQRKALNIHRTVMEQALASLKQSGDILKEANYSITTEALFLMTVYWRSFEEMFKGDISDASFCERAWSMLIPFLTEKGIQEYKQLIEPTF